MRLSENIENFFQPPAKKKIEDFSSWATASKLYIGIPTIMGSQWDLISSFKKKVFGSWEIRSNKA